jgi:hypothetical protein
MLEADEVDGSGMLGDCECSVGSDGGGDIEWLEEGEDLVDDCTCFSRLATSRLFIILRGNDFARFICSSIASSLIMSIKLAPFMSSFCSCKRERESERAHGGSERKRG